MNNHNTAPFFSVIILTYNRSNLLKEAIQSVLDQTYDNFELIIIDDHSTDNTKDVVESYTDKRIRYFLNDRLKGQAGARNAGLTRVVAEWITFLDDDDIWLPQKLDKQYQKIQEIDDTVGLIYTGYATYDFEQKKKLTEFVPEKEGWIQNSLFYSNYIGAICSVAIRKHVFDKVGWFDEKFQSMVDLEMWVRISSLFKVRFVDEILVYIRKSNSDRISVDMKKKMQGSLLFSEKYNHIIKNDARLKHYTAARIFYFSFRAKQWNNVINAVPWTLAGIYIDINNFLRTLWGILLVIIKSERAIRCSENMLKSK